MQDNPRAGFATQSKSQTCCFLVQGHTRTKSTQSSPAVCVPSSDLVMQVFLSPTFFVVAELVIFGLFRPLLC